MITIGVNNYMKDELLKGLTEEQIAKAKACKTQEELLALAKEEDINLTEEHALLLQTNAQNAIRTTLKPTTALALAISAHATNVATNGKNSFTNSFRS